MLVDDVTITINAGNGGNGSVHFRRNAQTAKGGPDGGNAGNGGNVYIQGVDDMLGLAEFRYKKVITAENGVNGGKNNLYGRNAEDTIIRIPLGTIVADTATGEEWEVTNTTEKTLIATGGKGGKGNKEFATPTDQAPHFAEKGIPGQKRTLHLVLRIIADVGFIGFPNAGKSSLLSALTNAKPKIANYPFTTLEPNLGVMPNSVIASEAKQSRLNLKGIAASPAERGPRNDRKQDLILADIPGLIEGASKGKGLGIQFLRHVEKTKMLVHCIDCTSDDAAKDYETIMKELKAYSETLASKKELILLTKTDLVDIMKVKKKIKELQEFGKEIITVSIYNEKSLLNLRQVLQTVSS